MKIKWGWVLILSFALLAIIGFAHKKSDGSFGSSPSQSSSPSPTATIADTSWAPQGFYGTVTGDSNIVWKETNTSGDAAFDAKWCTAFGPGMCYFYRVAVNENCSSVSGTLQLLNSLGEVEDTSQAASPASLSKGDTTTLVFQPTYNWKGKVKLSSLGCNP
jgi:hypothetical protein